MYPYSKLFVTFLITCATGTSRIAHGCIIGYSGYGIEAEVGFPSKEGRSWFDLGCIAEAKIIKSKNK